MTLRISFAWDIFKTSNTGMGNGMQVLQEMRGMFTLFRGMLSF